MEYQDKYHEMLSMLTEPVRLDDGKKYFLNQEFYNFYVKGHKISGTRIRKIMQKIRFKAKEVRDDVQNFKEKLDSDK